MSHFYINEDVYRALLACVEGFGIDHPSIALRDELVKRGYICWGDGDWYLTADGQETLTRLIEANTWVEEE